MNGLRMPAIIPFICQEEEISCARVTLVTTWNTPRSVLGDQDSEIGIL
jgi:hypothetical protein